MHEYYAMQILKQKENIESKNDKEELSQRIER